MSRLITADHLCVAMADIMQTELPILVASLELDLKPILTWQQVPRPEALSAGRFPAGLVTSPGLSDRPTRRGDGSHDATWRIAVGIADRGTDHQDTANKIRTWAALIRAVGLRNPTLNGLAASCRWVSEEYAERPEKNSARTIGGCVVTFDVHVKNVVDLTDVTGDLAGVVLTTHPSITVRTSEEE